MRKKVHGPYKKLSQIPLVSDFISDPHIAKVFRANDARWFYNQILNDPMCMGFNPYDSAVFMMSHSQIEKWYKKPDIDARQLNEADRLILEIFFAVHDYLHAWCYHCIHHLAPELGLGTKKITKENMDLFVFLHLITEVAAHVGLDYWFLSRQNVNDLLPVGTARIKGFAANFYFENRKELKRLKIPLNIDSPEFFLYLTKAFGNNIFPKISRQTLKRSALTRSWIQHQQVYLFQQRRYIREWFSNMGGMATDQSQFQLEDAIQINKKWQKDLVLEIANLLQKKLSHPGKYFYPAPPRTQRWDLYGPHEPFNQSYTNLNRVNPFKTLSELNQYGVNQVVSHYNYDDFNLEEKIKISQIGKTTKTKNIEQYFAHKRPLVSRNPEPFDLFFPG